jgi:transcriptional regulator with XRE-family HTH domain
MKSYFGQWLVEELRQRGWPQAEFARRAGISSASVSRVISGETGPGDDFIAGTARALDLPAERVMRLVGKLPDLGEVLPEAREWSARLAALSPDRRAAARRAIENILDLAEPPDRPTRP